MAHLLAALALSHRTLPELERWLRHLGLPPPDRMDRRALAALILIVESWRLLA